MNFLGLKRWNLEACSLLGIRKFVFRMVQKILSRQSAANCQLRRCVDVKKHTCGDVEKHSCGYVKKHCVKILRNIVAEASRK